MLSSDDISSDGVEKRNQLLRELEDIEKGEDSSQNEDEDEMIKD